MFFSAYASPITEDKRAVTDLNVRITESYFVYHLPKDTFSMLGSSRLEFLSVLYIKDTFQFVEIT